MMLRLDKSLGAWGTPDFDSVFKAETSQMGRHLPLQQGLSKSSYVSDDSIAVVFLSAEERAQTIRVRAGIFYEGVIAGCSCADDPTPMNKMTEHCVVQFDIDKQTAQTLVALLED